MFGNWRTDWTASSLLEHSLTLQNACCEEETFTYLLKGLSLKQECQMRAATAREIK
jgi:hypothetical protein